jgi:hypothetical protein
MRRLLLVGLLVAPASAAVGCHCVTGKCDCVSDAHLTHPYSTAALTPLQTPSGPTGAFPEGYVGPVAAAPTTYAAPAGPAKPGKEVLGMPKEGR